MPRKMATLLEMSKGDCPDGKKLFNLRSMLDECIRKNCAVVGDWYDCVSECGIFLSGLPGEVVN
jgi:hypothetical protein